MKVEIWSDVMCPFCYIGKHNFEQALEKLPFKDEIEVEWKSFQLDPTLDLHETKNSMTYFREKKGFPENQAKQMMDQVVQMGKQSGIDFNFEKALIINTFNAHKLLHLSKKINKSSDAEESLFKAHFIDGKNIGDIDFLVSAGEQLGLNTDDVRKVLESDELNTEIQQDISDAKIKGISGVPFFILNDKYGVSGAQPISTFENALTQTYNETVAPFKQESFEGNVCDEESCSI